METAVDATVPTGQFVLEEPIERVPDVKPEFVRSAVYGSACTMPFRRATTGRPERLKTALEDGPFTKRANRPSREAGRQLMKRTGPPRD